MAVVNVAQGLIAADTRTGTRKRKSDKCNLPPDVKLKCARYAVDVSSPSGALKKFEKEYPRYCFSRPTISRWTKILKDSISSGSDITEKMFSMIPGAPPLVASEIMGAVKDLVHGSREAGATIMRRDVINIAHGVILSTKPGLLKENGGSITLTDRWARNTLKSMSMVKRRGTTAKCKIPELLYEETKFTFQRNISTKVREFNIPPSLVINLDQTPLSYVTCEKYTFEALGSKTVPIAS